MTYLCVPILADDADSALRHAADAQRKGADLVEYRIDRLFDGSDESRADLAIEETRELKPGDFYSLLPPEGAIHAVTTISDEPSISIHLLGNDAGCTWRHAFEPDAGTVRAFRSGYSNRACE